MYIMYVDESGDPGLLNSPTKFFVLSAIVVHESRWRNFIDILVSHRKILKQVYDLPITHEIHAAEFINSKILNLKRHQRLAILRNTLDELAKIDFISVTNVVVDKTKKSSDCDVFAAGWKVLFQRFENTIKYGNLPGKYNADHGIVITDDTAGKNLTRIVRKMSTYNIIPNDNGCGSRNVPIKRIIEDPQSRNSKDSLPIQMCDVIAYFLYQKHAPNSYIRKNKAQNYLYRVEKILNKNASRRDQFGIVTL